MTSMFPNSFFNQNIGNWNVSKVQTFASSFQLSIFNNGGSSSISTWNTSACTATTLMFQGNTSFNQEIGTWNVSKVTDMSGMFNFAFGFNNGGSSSISNWSTSAVTNMSSMFNSANSFNQDLGGWNITGVTTMSLMLNNCGMNTSNYNNTLIGWSLQNVKTNVPLGASGLTYTISTAGPSRNILTGAPYNWVITGDTGI
jgi:surface protein